MDKVLVKDLLKQLDRIAPYALQESYDNSRLIVGNPKEIVKGVLCSLDSTEEVIDEAISRGCNVVVAHHPIVFSGLKSITGATYIERCMIKAIKHDIAIIACHTNLDSVKPMGINSRLANLLELSDTEFLVAKPNSLERNAGMGLVGNIEKPMEWSKFADFLKTKLHLKVFKHTKILKGSVQRIAICGGSGYFLLESAKSKKADVYITSDIKYHQFFDADNALVLADIGHYESEKHSSQLIHDIIIDKFSTFAVLLSNVRTNPITYYF